MSFHVKYVTYPDKIDEVRVELGSPEQYQIIKAVEKVPSVVVDESQELPKEFEILFKIVDSSSPSIISHRMSRENLGEYINILKQILAQTK
ncbi:hypothetical protein ACIQ1D_19290 [Lysinibacillus xylanilyticus]|uniref:hypothetical protein n=1 Tax=Lysinibacillus xylanilyticus TaxID=582475 RepID=UPI00382B0020